MENVCYFNSIKFWGGGEKLHLEYAVSFKRKGYKVYLACNKTSRLAKKGLMEGLYLFFIKAGNLSFLNPLKYLKLIYFYKKNKIDTVIFSVSQDIKLGGIAAKIAGVKNIVYLRGLAVPIKNSFINRYIFRKVLTHIVPNSNETKRTIFKYLGKYINEAKVKVIYHGIEIEKFENTKNINAVIKQKGNGIILGNAGRLTKQKGQQYLMDIARKLNENGIEFTLFIAGTGELQQSLENKIKEYKLENKVILMGFVSDIEGFMNSIDIFLLTSEWEGFGYVLVEAMACSKPTIAFDITSNPEIISDNETGHLVKFPDTTLFAEKIIALKNNKDKREKMGQAGNQSIYKRFLLNDRIDEFEQFIINKEKC